MVGITTVLVSAFTAYGVSKSMKNSNTELSELALANIEALAQNEENPWYLWPIQGITKDEYPEEKPCTEAINLVVWYVEWQGIRVICRDGGNQNCSTQICSE